MLDRTQAPLAEEISVPQIPQATSVALEGSLLHAVNQGAQPILLLELEIPVSRWVEPYPGLTYIVAKMLTEGTRTKSSEQLAEIFDFYGSHLEVTPTLDAVNIKLYTLKKFFPELTNVLAEMLSESIFPEKEFETLKRIRIQQIRQQHAKNDSYAGLKFREILYGEHHPYGQIVDEKSVSEVRLEDLKEYYRSFLVRPTFYLAGMVEEQDIEVVRKAFAGIGFLEPDSQASIMARSGNSQTITREGSSQASLRQGHLSITRHHEDTHVFKITNTLLGGFFGSRLMKNIREEKGLTYGIHSSLVHLNQSSYWCVSTEVLKEKLEVATDEIIGEIRKLQAHPPTAEELQTVTSYMKGKFVTSFDTPFNTLNMIKNLKSGGLDDTYYESFIKVLDTASPEQISEAARKYFDLEKMVNLSVA